jgi:hypothetical protein
MKRMALVLVGILMAAAVPAASMAADVNVNVQVAAEAPPPLEAQNPEMVVVPSGNSYVYMVPNTYGVYFHNGFWFRYYNGVWFRSAVYNSGWAVVRPALVPRVVVGVYPEYAMYLPAGYFRIGWGDFHSHWRGWGPGYWHSRPWFKQEMRARAERHRHIERQRSDWGRGHGSAPHGYHVKNAGPHGGVHKGGTKGSSVHKAGPHEKGFHK